VKCKTEFMVVRIRFGRGPVVSRRQGKNSRMALLAASLLTLVSVAFASLGMWRLGTDVGWAGEFVFSSGLLSHWQVWIGAAVIVQYTGWRLTRYARAARKSETEAAPDTATAKPRTAANTAKV
jgi:hypothetical protein